MGKTRWPRSIEEWHRGADEATIDIECELNALKHGWTQFAVIPKCTNEYSRQICQRQISWDKPNT